ncbi:nitroreductase [Williamsia deligens]|uniref:Nitroreductase n=1 Tax=Williamsia deligens TaxID=321325 RepID=A0ABW3G562_9NOCA|nr:nitroreductase [Williamsia deligens]MCP2194500.1 Nitroreductase [Williamsia deligens]
MKDAPHRASWGLWVGDEMSTRVSDRAEDEVSSAARTVEAAVRTRRSVRAFLPTPVPRADVERLLALAARAASNSNSQPWHVYVLTGDAKRQVTAALWDALDFGRTGTDPRYPYQPPRGEWEEPFRSRRSAFGAALYQDTLGVDRGDTEGRDAHHRRNYDFFGAPVGLILTVSAHMRSGALVDAGLFLQSLMLLAREAGLDTCAQASFIDYDAVLREHLPISDDEIVVCGVSLGHADPDAAVNEHRTGREALKSFATFVGEAPHAS